MFDHRGIRQHSSSFSADMFNPWTGSAGGVRLFLASPYKDRRPVTYVEDLLHERGVDVSHEMIRFWWHRFGPMFAAEIRKRRIQGMKSSRWQWHLDEVFVKMLQSDGWH
jgi:transposase-like protein